MDLTPFQLNSVHHFHSWHNIDFYSGSVLVKKWDNLDIYAGCNALQNSHGSEIFCFITGIRYRKWFIQLPSFTEWFSYNDLRSCSHQLSSYVQLKVFYIRDAPATNEWNDFFPRNID